VTEPREERVAVERRPANRALGDAELAFQERTIEAEERGEEAVVSKEARVTEEVVVRREAEQRTETVSDTVRQTEVEVEDERGNKISGTEPLIGLDLPLRGPGVTTRRALLPSHEILQSASA
jgi:stress response protein YsnF